MRSHLPKALFRGLTLPPLPSDARPHARKTACLRTTVDLSSPPSHAFYPRHGSPPGIARIVSLAPLSHSTGGPSGTRSLPHYTTCHPSEQSALGGGWGPGGRRAPCAPAKGPSFPPKPAISALLSALAKAATDFYTHVLAGRPHGMQPCPAARGRKRPSWRESACSSLLRPRSHENRKTLSTRRSGPVFHYLTAPAEQQRIL